MLGIGDRVKKTDMIPPLMNSQSRLIFILDYFRIFLKSHKNRNNSCMIGTIHSAFKYNIKILFNHEYEEALVFARKGQIIRVVVNLLSNAIQALESVGRGYVRISLMQKAGCPKFCVSVLISGWVESPQGSASSQV